MSSITGKSVAAQLRELADRIEKIPVDIEQPRLSIQPVWSLEDRTEQVDVLAQTILGIKAETKYWKNIQWRHFAQDDSGAVNVDVFVTVPAPAEEDPATLRARIVELEARLAAQGGQS